LAEQLCEHEHLEELDAYRQKLQASTVAERLASERPMTGVFLGRHAQNPITGETVPIYASDYVLAEYGTGAIMAVPAHDQRDLNFAIAMGLPVRVVIDTGLDDPKVTGRAADGDGVLVNSGAHTGLPSSEAAETIAARLQELGKGEPTVVFRLRDWLLSRQRYWGTPIPIVHCPACGEVPVPEDQLPVRLPVSGYELRPAHGQSPLESAADWVRVQCPHCGGDARRDTDTMDTFVDSSWYFLRYPSAKFESGPFDPQSVQAWLPVDEYIGGKEHATGHLMYSRFLTKVLYDLDLVTFTEPFTRLTNQGQVIMNGKAMSKTLGNLVNLQDQIAAYGPDAVRVTMLFAGPPEDDIDWADVSPTGSTKWLARVWRLVEDVVDSPEAREFSDDMDLITRRETHRLVDQITAAMDEKRFNVAIARMMTLTTVLRRAHESRGAATPTIREGVEALVRMLSCFAPFLAEDAWERLGYNPSVATTAWPNADPALLVDETVTCIIQVAGKVRDRIEVPPGISAGELERLVRELARTSDKLRSIGADPSGPVVVREPRLVNFVPRR
jgi:leucyl-tRNA synthetase